MVSMTHGNERGFGIIEVVAAMLLVVIGVLGTFTAFISSDHANLTMQREQAVSTAAEQAMEQLRSMTYANLALSSLPSTSSAGNPSGDNSKDPLDPDYWVSGSNLFIPASFSQESTTPLTNVASTGEALISGGTVAPGPTAVTSDGFTVDIYRYITWFNDTCTYGITNLCSSVDDAKRVTVAAVLANQTGTTDMKPVWLTTIVANPKA